MQRQSTLESFENGREDTVAALYAVLERDNSLSRCRAVRALERLIPRGGEPAERLVAMLTDPDADVRIDCAAALGVMRAAWATQPLIDNLRFDPDGDVRIEAAGALARIGGDAAVEPLIACLRADGYPDLDMLVDDMEYRASCEVQSRVLSGLGEIGDARAARPVLELLEHEDYEDLQETGFRVLARLDGALARDFLLRQLKDGRRLARRRSARALGDILSGGGERTVLLDALTGALGDDDPAVRIGAGQALAASREPGVVIPLARLLADPNDEVRRRMAATLATLRGPGIAERLHALLDETEPHRRRGIVEVLGEIADPASRDPLSRLLDSPDSDLLYAAVHALGRLGLAGPEEAIAAILAGAASSPALRTQAAWALGRILPAVDEAEPEDGKRPDPRAILKAAVFDASEGVSLAALSALVDIDSGAAETMLAGLLRGDLAAPPTDEEPRADEEARTDEEAEEIVLEDDDPEGSTLASILAGHPQDEPLADAEPAPDEEPPRALGRPVRVLAARLLGNLANAGAKSVAALVDAAGGEEAGLRREAMLSLGRIGDDTALPVLLTGLAATDRDLRLAAIEAVAGFTATAYVREHMLRLLDDPDPFVRQRVVETLCRVAPDSIPTARLLTDPEREVCRAALGALPAERRDDDLSGRIIALMFGFSGELRHDAARALRRMGDGGAVAALLAILDDPGREDVHWICIDALAEMLALEPTGTDCKGAGHAGALV